MGRLSKEGPFLAKAISLLFVDERILNVIAELYFTSEYMLIFSYLSQHVVVTTFEVVSNFKFVSLCRNLGLDLTVGVVDDSQEHVLKTSERKECILIFPGGTFCYMLDTTPPAGIFLPVTSNNSFFFILPKSLYIFLNLEMSVSLKNVYMLSWITLSFH